MREKNSGLAPIIIILLITVVAAGAYFLGTKNKLLFPQISLSPSPALDPTANWELYKNSKFGFFVKYPSELNLTPKEFDIKANQREYIQKCETGVYKGCGGGRWPDYKIIFTRQNGNSAFDVRIYQLPVKQSFGGVEKDSFTFIVSTGGYFGENIESEPVDEQTLDLISSTLGFIKPDKPLACLWSTEGGPGFDPEKDKEYIDEWGDNLTLLFGYYFSQSKQSCQKTTFYTWKEQTDTDASPFNTLDECVSSCSTN